MFKLSINTQVVDKQQFNDLPYAVGAGALGTIAAVATAVLGVVAGLYIATAPLSFLITSGVVFAAGVLTVSASVAIVSYFIFKALSQTDVDSYIPAATGKPKKLNDPQRASQVEAVAIDLPRGTKIHVYDKKRSLTKFCSSVTTGKDVMLARKYVDHIYANVDDQKAVDHILKNSNQALHIEGLVYLIEAFIADGSPVIIEQKPNQTFDPIKVYLNDKIVTNSEFSLVEPKGLEIQSLGQITVETTIDLKTGSITRKLMRSSRGLKESSAGPTLKRIFG